MRNFSAYALRPLINSYEDRIHFASEGSILKKSTAYFDWCATGLYHEAIEHRVRSVIPYYANMHSSSSKHAIYMTDLYEACKVRIKDILKLSDEYVIIGCGNGSTAAIKKFQELLGIYIPPRSKNYVQIKREDLPIVIVGGFEHHSNEISFRQGLCEIWRIPFLYDFSFDLDALENKLIESRGKKIILSFSPLSNVTGNPAPTEEILQLARLHNCIVAVDAAMAFGNLPIDFNNFDAIFFSPHKLLGGPGSCGILAIKKKLMDITLPPTFCGGGVVEYVDRQNEFYKNEWDIREEAGTLPIISMFRAALAFSLQDEIGLDLIFRKKRSLMRIFTNELEKLDFIEVYGQPNHIAVISFNIRNISPHDLCYFLSHNYLIQARSGCSCAGPYMHDLLKIEDNQIEFKSLYGWLRISLHYTHTLDDINYFFKAMNSAVRALNPRLLNN